MSTIPLTKSSTSVSGAHMSFCDLFVFRHHRQAYAELPPMLRPKVLRPGYPGFLPAHRAAIKSLELLGAERFPHEAWLRSYAEAVDLTEATL